MRVSTSIGRAISALILLVLSNITNADERDRLKVGLQPDGRIVVPTNQILQPAGKQVTFPGRPVDLLLIEDGKTLVAKNMRNLVFIDPATGAVRQTLALPAATGRLGGAFSAVGLVAVGDQVVASDSQNAVRFARRNDRGEFAWDGHVELKAPAVGGAAYPTGMALQGESHLWVCANRGNELQIVNLTNNAVEARVPVGVAPYMPVVVGDKVYVSNWGGNHPGKDATHTSSKTPVKTDPRTSVANHGSVSVVTKAGDGWKETKSIAVGGHPSGMAAHPTGRFLYVANANSDTVSVIDTVGSSRVDLQACKLEYSIVSPK